MAKKKPPTDINQLAKFITDQATKEPAPIPEPKPIKEKNPAAVALGRLGGLKGGKARANKLTSDQRREIAEKAAKTRWLKKSSSTP
jgi:hypothetical protein